MVVSLSDKLASVIFHKPADRGQSKFREHCSPFRLQPFFCTGRHSEEQLVILTVLQAIFTTATPVEGKLSQVHLKTDLTCPRQAGKIACEAIAQIHHRMHRKSLNQPPSFSDAGPESQVFTGDRSA
jgi:hypothetical protein